MNPKSGKAGSAVTPADPKEPEEADVADPGEVEKIKAEQREAEKGKYGSTPATPHKSDSSESDPAKKSWIELQLLREDDGKPVTSERYKITLPDGSVAEGTTDNEGLARLDGIDPGQCKIQFPNLDGRESERS
jgi:type VI secretion system secreted protein VgrG